jgi:hypothetical protein
MAADEAVDLSSRVDAMHLALELGVIALAAVGVAGSGGRCGPRGRRRARCTCPARGARGGGAELSALSSNGLRSAAVEGQAGAPPGTPRFQT